MRRIILFIVLLIMIFVFIVSKSFDVTLNTRGYDILLKSKKAAFEGYGINYKEGFSVWRFWRPGYGGTMEKKILPPRPSGGV